MGLLDILKTDPASWTPEMQQAVSDAFYDQHAPVYRTIGGFFNPTVEGATETTIYFRCFYDGYDNEDDSWNYEVDRLTGKFRQ